MFCGGGCGRLCCGAAFRAFFISILIYVIGGLVASRAYHPAMLRLPLVVFRSGDFKKGVCGGELVDGRRAGGRLLRVVSRGWEQQCKRARFRCRRRLASPSLPYTCSSRMSAAPLSSGSTPFAPGVGERRRRRKARMVDFDEVGGGGRWGEVVSLDERGGRTWRWWRRWWWW